MILHLIIARTNLFHSDARTPWLSQSKISTLFTQDLKKTLFCSSRETQTSVEYHTFAERFKNAFEMSVWVCYLLTYHQINLMISLSHGHMQNKQNRAYTNNTHMLVVSVDRAKDEIREISQIQGFLCHLDVMCEM